MSGEPFNGTRLRDIVREMSGEENVKASKVFRVDFHRVEGPCLRGDFFPGRDEHPFKTEEEAWMWAKILDVYGPKNIRDIYVVYACDFSPVSEYKKRALRRKEQDAGNS